MGLDIGPDWPGSDSHPRHRWDFRRRSLSLYLWQPGIDRAGHHFVLPAAPRYSRGIRGWVLIKPSGISSGHKIGPRLKGTKSVIKTQVFADPRSDSLASALFSSFKSKSGK